MNMRRHGLSIGIERDNNQLFLFLEVIGKLTHEDYGIITPMLESALEGLTEPKIRVLIDAFAMEGWEPRAAWDDLKLGLKHGNEFERVETAKREVKKNPETCKRAQENLSTLDSYARIRVRDEQGNYRYIDEDEKAAQRAQAEELVRVHCE